MKGKSFMPDIYTDLKISSGSIVHICPFEDKIVALGIVLPFETIDISEKAKIEYQKNEILPLLILGSFDFDKKVQLMLNINSNSKDYALELHFVHLDQLVLANLEECLNIDAFIKTNPKEKQLGENPNYFDIARKQGDIKTGLTNFYIKLFINYMTKKEILIYNVKQLNLLLSLLKQYFPDEYRKGGTKCFIWN